MYPKLSDDIWSWLYYIIVDVVQRSELLLKLLDFYRIIWFAMGQFTEVRTEVMLTTVSSSATDCSCSPYGVLLHSRWRGYRLKWCSTQEFKGEIKRFSSKESAIDIATNEEINATAIPAANQQRTRVQSGAEVNSRPFLLQPRSPQGNEYDKDLIEGILNRKKTDHALLWRDACQLLDTLSTILKKVASCQPLLHRETHHRCLMNGRRRCVWVRFQSSSEVSG